MESSLLVEERLDFNGLSEVEIKSLLEKYGIGLTTDEILRVQNALLKRPPTLSECLLWSIQGSEHCSYKSSKTFLKNLPTKAPHLIVGIGEDAAVVSVAKSNDGYRYGIAISHESHNHPSQIVPFEGAATGVGGNVRDIACMGATVIAVADSLRFGALHNNHKTRWLNKEVVSGIASYGNALGIPNIAGDVAYHANYQNNCLVTVVSLGVIREDKVIHSYVPKCAEGYALILVGKATDNSGFGGASFASTKLNEGEMNRGAVQEPNAFLERHLLKANQALIEQLDNDGLLPQVAFKDLGAGGIGCASVELAFAGGFGAEVNLDNVHVGMENLHPSVILCSETQERFMWAVPQNLVDVILDHYNKTFDLPNVSHFAQASVVGKVIGEPNFIVSHKDKLQINAKSEDVTEGLTIPRAYEKPNEKSKQVIETLPSSLEEAWLNVLSSPNVACQKALYEHYDKQVQGRTVIERGQAKAGVLSPFNDESYPEDIRKTGVALALSQNPRHTLCDPFWGTQKAVITAMERLACVGASPIAMTDCLCFGNPEKPQQMWEFVEAIKAISHTCKSYHLYQNSGVTMPVVAGNVSFYNESNDQAIPASPMISCLGRMDDSAKAIKHQFQKTDSRIYLLRDETLSLAGSIYGDFYQTDTCLPQQDMARVEARIHFMLDCITKEKILSANTINEGGLAAALSVMSTQGNIGVNIELLEQQDGLYQALFAETGGFVFEVSQNNCAELEKLAMDNNFLLVSIGQTQEKADITICHQTTLNFDQLKNAWLNPLQEQLL